MSNCLRVQFLEIFAGSSLDFIHQGAFIAEITHMKWPLLNLENNLFI